MVPIDAARKDAPADSASTAPVLQLPKGGGAVRGMGEKFTANPVTGTGSMTVPIATSPGRSGFGPQLSLSYNSGSGNGVFGFGWSLSVPSITRKTDTGVPVYDDVLESDVFVLSGTEDLVPILAADGSFDDVLTTVPGYAVRRYRPRIEGLYARIERWTRVADGDVHWRSISKENVLTVYGLDQASRIVDPADRRRIFSWLITETRDDKGNAVVYGYRPDDAAGADLTKACERNRGGPLDVRRGTNRYLKSIRYGNRGPLLDSAGHRPRFLADLPSTQIGQAGWMFEVIFDYGEHALDRPAGAEPAKWTYRQDPFSSYRAGFEVRTTRLCQRVLMVHHVPDSANGARGYDGVVRSTDFTYSYEQDPTNQRNPVYTFLCAATQTGYPADAGQPPRRLPPLEFEYSQPVVHDTLQEVDPASLENLPVGVDDAGYRWVDLHGDGIPGIVTEQGGAWYYKRNLSPISTDTVTLAPLEQVGTVPTASLSGARAQFMDLAGDGQTDLVMLDGPTPGLYEHDEAEGWGRYRPFTARLNRAFSDANTRLVDLNGDGHADVLITEHDALVSHRSLAEDGFGPARHTAWAADEEHGPRVVFAQEGELVALADLSGDGLTDLVRIRHNEVAYWPNCGGKFGAKVTMDHAPWYDDADQFDHSRLLLADIDGTGTTDLIYLHRDGVRLYFNQSGNGWSDPTYLDALPSTDTMVSIAPADLLGNGTACLVWSSPMPGDARAPMRYVRLMGEHKPHLLVRSVNNLGAETVIDYAPSTKFSLQDRRDGRPWITRLPFPVHVVERVTTYDRISRNRFVTRFAYHHGFFDGSAGEREFRGFAMVEQWDAESLDALGGSRGPTTASNEGVESDVPPVLTRTWFHTGVHAGGDGLSRYFAGLLDDHDEGEYYREPGLTDAQARSLLLPDTIVPTGLTPEEEREACRALKGSMLRQEVYALDGTPRSAHPYTVLEQSFGVRLEQPRGERNRHAVFSVHPVEAITYHYERNPTDPRIQHVLTLEVDAFGNVVKEAAIGYGRRRPDLTLPLEIDRRAQRMPLVTYTERSVTNAIDDVAPLPETRRTPVPCETRTYELTGYVPSAPGGRFGLDDLVRVTTHGLDHIFDTEIGYADHPTNGRQRRLIELSRILFRADDLTSLLPLGRLEPRALTGESYQLALTGALCDHVYRRAGVRLLRDQPGVLAVAGIAADRGGYVSSAMLAADGRFPAHDVVDGWWQPGGRVYLSPDSTDTPTEELSYALGHFFLPHRTRDAFHTKAVSTESTVAYDEHQLLPVETRDALGNRVTVGERRADGTIDTGRPGNDYRVLQSALVTDANRNRTQVAFDALGMVVGTAVMGKRGQDLGDSLVGFVSDLDEVVTLAHLAKPVDAPEEILGRATTRLVYDLFAYHRSRSSPMPQPVAVYTLQRETHDRDLAAGATSKVQHTFSYGDGFGREIQKVVLSEPGPVVTSGPVVHTRWARSGWTIFNNKGKPVRQYQPEFVPTHHFEFGVQAGVSSVLFYDPMERVITTLHPNSTYDKVVFDPWHRVTWDVNDTVLLDPQTDVDVSGYTAGYFAGLPTPGWTPWRTPRRTATALGPQERDAARQAEVHADTPTTVHFDALGRPFLTVEDNGVDVGHLGSRQLYATRVELDIEGNQRAVRDAVRAVGDQAGRIVMTYDYDLLGNRLFARSMEAGARWMLGDVAGNPIRSWDDRGHAHRSEYDALRRPVRTYVAGDPTSPGGEVLTERLVYGEQHPEAEQRNLRSTEYLHLDQAGGATIEENDFKGKPLRVTRRLTSGIRYTAAVDWRAVDANHLALPTDGTVLLDLPALHAALSPFLEADVYTSTTTYDALSRPMVQTTPHTRSMVPNLVRRRYNEAGLLVEVEANLRGATVNGRPDWTPFVDGVDYDARGQRREIRYGNGVTTTYTYDPLTFRLAHMETRRSGALFPGDCPGSPRRGWPGCGLQALHYTYDPVGNITHITDSAQQTVFFSNRRIQPSVEYTYDPIYRLIEATGREQLGKSGPVPHSSDDALRCHLPHRNSGDAVAPYTESYRYDSVGNILEMRHVGHGPGTATTWQRTYDYAETSLIEDGTGVTRRKPSNRLTSTKVGNRTHITERYMHDAHGNMTRVPHLGGHHPGTNLHWDHLDQLCQADLGGGGTVYFVYDAAGQRVRKVWQKAPTSVEERIYLGGFEIFRRRSGTELLERETLHIMDDRQRVAIVETRTADTAATEAAPPELVRFQFGDHLGSASLELDQQARVISYEEYSPYGSTTYQAVRSRTETPKRYRYTGKERDSETGFYYHGARYFAPWIARWTSAAAAGERDRLDAYAYVNGRPTVMHDPDGHDGVFGVYLAGVGDAVVGLLTGASLQEHALAYRSAGGGAEGVLAVIDKSNPFSRIRDRGASAYGSGGLDGTLRVVEAFNPVAQMRDTAADSYRGAGGGVDGIAAALDALNPAARVRDSGTAAVGAVQRGDLYSAGKYVTQFLLGAAALAAPFSKGVGLAARATNSEIEAGVMAKRAARTSASSLREFTNQGGEFLEDGVASRAQPLPLKRKNKSGRTKTGTIRKNRTDWKRWRDDWDEAGYGDILSKKNRASIAAKSGVPIVDEEWIKEFPGDADLVGEEIRLHHIGASPVTVPLPETRHLDAHMPGGFKYNIGGPGTTG